MLHDWEPKKQAEALFDSLIVIRETNDVVLAQIITKLNFNDCQTDIAAVSQAMIGFGRYVYMLAFLQSQFTVATDDISYTFYHDPMFAAPRVSLQAEARTWFYLQNFNLITGLLLENFVGAPRSFVKFSHKYSFLV